MRGKPFKPGNKLGKGRPKGSSYIDVCQQWAEHSGWEQLLAWATGKENGKRVPWAIRKFAVNTILAYGFGRPREAIDVSGTGPQSLAEAMQAALAKRQKIDTTGII